MATSGSSLFVFDRPTESESPVQLHTSLNVGHIRKSLLDFCFASLFRTTSFEALSESASRQQSECSDGSSDLDPLGVDQSWGCASSDKTEKAGVLYVG